MREASKNAAIGILVVLALVLVLWVLLFLHPTFGDGKFRLHVRFGNIEKINEGTRVTYAGRAVGEVVKITQIPEEERHAEKGDPNEMYIYDLTLAIDSHIPLYNSDEITVGTAGLMGERYIAIIPRRPKEHKAIPVTFNEVLYSTKAPSLDDAFDQVSKVTETADATMQVLANLVQENREEVTATLKSLKAAASELNTFLANANKSNMVQSMTNTAQAVERTMQQANDLIAQVSSGQGTIGKLLMSDDFYIKTAGVMNKIDVLMNDVNHYGVLFHLDKSWQRDRRKRIEELSSLQSPQQFRTFINDEMLKITNAVSRLGMALDKAQKETGSDKPLVANNDFARSFNELLNQVQDLQGTLKHYSIEIADKQPVQEK